MKDGPRCPSFKKATSATLHGWSHIICRLPSRREMCSLCSWMISRRYERNVAFVIEHPPSKQPVLLVSGWVGYFYLALRDGEELQYPPWAMFGSVQYYILVMSRHVWNSLPRRKDELFRFEEWSIKGQKAFRRLSFRKFPVSYNHILIDHERRLVSTPTV